MIFIFKTSLLFYPGRPEYIPRDDESDGSPRYTPPVPHAGRQREREDKVGRSPQRAPQDTQEEQASGQVIN